jgi:hypothetical protein
MISSVYPRDIFALKCATKARDECSGRVDLDQGSLQSIPLGKYSRYDESLVTPPEEKIGDARTTYFEGYAYVRVMIPTGAGMPNSTEMSRHAVLGLKG